MSLSHSLDTANKIQLKEIQHAILKRDVKQIKQQLNTNPQLLLCKDDKGRSLLHFAAKKCHNQRIISLLLAQLIQLNQLNEAMRLGNKRDQTPIHLAVLHNTSRVVRVLINALGSEKNSILRLADNKGSTPLALLTSRKKEDRRESYKIYQLLEQGSLFNTVEKLSNTVIVKKEGSDRLKRNLDIANKVINDVRSVITVSNTHPDLNYSPIKTVQDATEKVKEFRTQNPVPQFKTFLDLENHVKKIEDSHTGNCGEMAYVALHRLRKNYPHISSILGSIQNGDHAFVLIDIEKPNEVAKMSIPDFLSKYAEHGVICDPWSGKAFPASQMLQQIENYYRVTPYKRTLNLLSHFNPNIHGLGLNYDAPPQVLTQPPNPLKRNRENWEKDNLTANASQPDSNKRLKLSSSTLSAVATKADSETAKNSASAKSAPVADSKVDLPASKTVESRSASMCILM